MIQLLGKPTSINVRKVLWLAAELQLPLQHDPAPADVATLNPNGLVPVLVDDGFVVWESNTICRYLAGREHAFDLLPAEPAARARVEQWMDWQATDLNAAWRYAFMARVRQSAAHADERAIETSVAEWNRLMTVLDGQLARSAAYAAGERFTLADIVLGLSANRWRLTPMPRPELPAVDAWFERLRERPAFRQFGDNGTP
jgi:glutathione S-transferase